MYAGIYIYIASGGREMQGVNTGSSVVSRVNRHAGEAERGPPGDLWLLERIRESVEGEYRMILGQIRI